MRVWAYPYVRVIVFALLFDSAMQSCSHLVLVEVAAQPRVRTVRGGLPDAAETLTQMQ